MNELKSFMQLSYFMRNQAALDNQIPGFGSITHGILSTKPFAVESFALALSTDFENNMKT